MRKTFLIIEESNKIQGLIFLALLSASNVEKHFGEYADLRLIRSFVILFC